MSRVHAPAGSLSDSFSRTICRVPSAVVTRGGDGDGQRDLESAELLSHRRRHVAGGFLLEHVDETTAGVGNGVARSSHDLPRCDPMSVDLRMASSSGRSDVPSSEPPRTDRANGNN